MYAEIHSKDRGPPSSRLYQVMFDSVGYRTVVHLIPIPLYGYCIHNLGTI